MAALPELSLCPCGLPYEDVRDHCLGEGTICTAFRKGSRAMICGELLVDHPHQSNYQAPPAQSFVMTCDIRVIHGDIPMVMTVIVDPGCQEELTLEPTDIETLNLPQIGTREVSYPDGSTGEAKMYDTVRIEVPLSDGSVVQASSVAPVSLTQVDQRVGAVAAVRILGYPALNKLNLKLDYRAKRVVERIRRI